MSQIIHYVSINYLLSGFIMSMSPMGMGRVLELEVLLL